LLTSSPFLCISARSDTLSKAITPTTFFAGGEEGTIVFADDMKHCHDVQQLSAAIDAMLFYEEKKRLVILTRTLLMIQLQVGDNGVITPIMKVKLSVASSSTMKNVTWAGPGLLASVSTEKIIRFWDLAGDENYVLSLSTAGSSIAHNDKAVAVSFNPIKSVLAVGTSGGKVVMWKLTSTGGTAAADGKDSKVGKKGVRSFGPTSAADWEPLLPIKMDGKVKSLEWGPGENLLGAAVEGRGPSILNETVLHRKLYDECAAMQNDAKQIIIEAHTGPLRTLETNIRVKGIAMDERHVAVWNGKKAEIYDVLPSGTQRTGEFECTARTMVIHKECIYRAVGNRVEVCNLAGVQKFSTSFTEVEGTPEHLDINGKYLAVATSGGRLKVFDVSRGREPKEMGSGGSFVDADGEIIGEIRSIHANCDGNRISILSDLIHGVTDRMRSPDSRIHVYNADTDLVNNYEFGPARFPVSHCWDPAENKLLACETLKTKKNAGKTGKGKEAARSISKAKDDEAEKKDGADGEKKKVAESEVEVTTLFVTTEHGLMMQDSFLLEPHLEALLGIKVPRFYFMAKITDEMQSDEKGADAKGSGEKGVVSRLKHRVMRDFVGLETVDGETKNALLAFSYYLTVGNMDEAYKAVKLIKSASVWENMAHMCVKTKRLDVAEVCLGNMMHARGARAVREVKAKEPELEARVGMVAIQLGLLDDAAKLYEECGRHDLLNKLYQAAGQWDRALEVATEHDRIHLRTTHYAYAKHLESIGETSNAIKHYERSDTHRKEVPRLLFDAQYVDDLESYITQAADKELLKWWAQYCESNGYFEKASHFYSRAEDHLSLVRVACYNREFQRAADIVRNTQSKAAAYHLARQHEGTGNIQEAISYFSQAGRYNHAMRLAKEHGLDSELTSFALQSTQAHMLDAALYFEQKGAHEKAVQLYQKGGNIPKALDLCFRAQLFDVLRSISDELGDESSPETLARCADFFKEHGQYEKSVHLLLTGKQYDEALDVCMAQKIKITEEMAERMTLPKGKDEVENARRVALLEKVAKCCKKQGSFHLATKKYTQTGVADNKIKAMKCLLKSGDTEKIIFFADVSRNQKIYILAANYLQNLDWHNDPEIMKAIIKFYTKAKAFEQLSGFYDACAQVEIDEYRDYEKALGALKESVKYMIKAKGANKEEQLASLHQRIQLVEIFVQARRLVKTDPAEMVKICHQLLDRPDVEVGGM
jgi:intraflagellar transport protein 140